MPNAKRPIQSAITIGGTPLIWHLHREQQYTTEHMTKGLAIHVRVVEGAHRELFLEYPVVRRQLKDYSMDRLNARPTIAAAKVAAHIREAMAAGWDPGSRGKPFVYQVSELPN
ncbi:MAG TPA: hypothetical protein VN776_12695 [Terracidiphilus sp.]|nr:hypothetical protein [Terracidiphilus sp.]